MKITDNLWKNVWSIEKYKPISDKYRSRGFSTDLEPESSVCMASFANAMGNKFKEGVVLFDYGCGSARFCNFMSKRLDNFFYYGVEKLGSLDNWGEKAIAYAQSHFGKDNRIKLGFIGDDVEKEAINNAEVALLLSIFTHTDIKEMNSIMDKLMPIILRGGSVIFSVFIRDTYRCINNLAYGFERCYAKTEYNQKQINEISERLNINIDKIDTLESPSGHKDKDHTIFKAHKWTT